MLIYEKNNKLNISFDNEIKENPDLQIGKEDGKTEIMVDGQKYSSLPDMSQAEAGYVLKLVGVPEERVVSEIKNVSGESNTVLFAGFPTDGSTSSAIYTWINSFEGIYPDNGSLTNIHSIEYAGREIIPYITVLTNWSSDRNYTEYKFYSAGRIAAVKRQGSIGVSFPIENLTFTIYGIYPKVVPQWASVSTISDGGGHGTK